MSVDFFPAQIAVVYIHCGDRPKAEDILRKVISEHSQGPDRESSVPLARAMRALADLYLKESRRGDAEPLYRKALAIFKNYPESRKEDPAAVTKSLDELRKK